MSRRSFASYARMRVYWSWRNRREKRLAASRRLREEAQPLFQLTGLFLSVVILYLLFAWIVLALFANGLADAGFVLLGLMVAPFAVKLYMSQQRRQIKADERRFRELKLKGPGD